MNRTTVSPVDLDTETDLLNVTLGILRKIQQEYHDEQRRVEDWFEVEDREMHAYHRGKSRGLLFCIQALETNLKLVGAISRSDNGPARRVDQVLPVLSVRV